MDQRSYREQSMGFGLDPMSQDTGLQAAYAGQSSQPQGRYFGGMYDNLYPSYHDDHYFNGMSLNPRQVFWIRKRKMRRETLDALMVIQKNNYVHESRHRHAMKRLRAPSGRFLTKKETAEFLGKQGPSAGK